MSHNELAPLFRDRNARLNAFPDEQRIAFQAAEKASGDPMFADRQLSAIWLSKRTGLAHQEVIQHYDALASRYFGEGATPATAYDRISALYAPKPAAAAGAGGPALPEQPQDAYAVSGTVVAKDVVGSLGAGAATMGYDTLGGFYANLAAATGVTMRRPTDDTRYTQASAELRALQDIGESPLDIGATRGPAATFRMTGRTPEQYQLLFGSDRAALESKRAELSAQMRAIEEETQIANEAALAAAEGTFFKRYSDNARQISRTMYELSRESPDAMGVTPEFQQTTVGKLTQTVGSLPVTALFASIGPVLGSGAIYSGIYGQVEQERMGVEGAGYDAQAAFWDNVASAGPQAVLEFAFGMERLMGNVIKLTPKSGGRIVFGDAVRLMGKRGLVAGAEEGLTAPTQNLWNDYLASLTYDEKREVFTADAFKERLVESASAFALGTLFGVAVTGLSLVDRNRGAERARAALLNREGQPMDGPDYSMLRAAKTDEELRALESDPKMADLLIAAANGDEQAQAAHAAETRRRAFVDTDGLAAEGVTIGKVGETVALRSDTGEIAILDLENPEHKALLETVQAAALAKRDFITQAKEAIGEELSITEREKFGSFSEMIEAGEITREDAQSAIDIQKALGKITAAATVETVGPQAKSSAREVGEGVYQRMVTIAKSASPTAAIEDIAEAYVHQQFGEQKLTPAELRTELAAFFKKAGREDVAARDGLTGDALTISDIESFSKLAVDYALGNRKAVLPGSWGKWLRKLGAQLKEMIRGAAQMRKLMRDGELPPNLERMLKESLGAQPVTDSEAVQAPTEGEPGGLMSTFAVGPASMTNPNAVYQVTGVAQTQKQAIQQAVARIAAQQAASFPYPYHLVAPKPVQAQVSAAGHEAGWMGKALMPMSERLRELGGKLGGRSPLLSRVRRYYNETGVRLKYYSEKVTPLMRGIQRMTADDMQRWALAASNGDVMMRNSITSKYGLDNAWASYEQARDELRAEMIAAGIEVGEIQDYFPRWVKDVVGLRESLGVRDAEGVLEKAMIEAEKSAGRTLTTEEVNAVLNKAAAGVRFGPVGSAKPSNAKMRKIATIFPEQWPFYADPNHALSRWLKQGTEAAARFRFFGKDAKINPNPPGISPSQIDLDASIGSILAEEVSAGRLSPTAQNDVRGMMEAMFGFHGVTNKYIRGFMNLSYWATMGKVSSALTQVVDVMTSVYEAGPWDAAMAIPQAMWQNLKSLPGIGNVQFAADLVGKATKGKLSRDDLGIDRMLAEFDDQSKSATALQHVFTAVGLNYIDSVGKDVMIIAKFRQLTRQARRGQLSAKNARMIEGIFGAQKAQQVIADFAVGAKTPDTIFAVYNVLADWQPIALSEYPEGYLRNPNARLLYMLKSYSIKMLGAYRREGFLKMWYGSPAQKLEGARNLTYLMGLLWMAGASKDWLVDFILDRDPHMDDIMVDNVFKLMQVSRYTLWQARNRSAELGAYGYAASTAEALKNSKAVIVDMIVPPFTLFERPAKDVAAWAKAKGQGDPFDVMTSESIQFIPGAGEYLYWTGETGQAKIERRRKLREAAER